MRRVGLLTELRRGLANQELELRYQPVVDLRTGRVTKVEALLRWQRVGAGAQLSVELLEMAVELNRTQHRTIALVLHDMNLAARYSDWIIAMKHGEIVAAGTPSDVITKELLAEVFEVEATIVIDPDTNAPFVLIDRRIAA